MPTIKQATAEFLAGKRVAVTGVSRTPQGHGSNVVYRRLRQRGYEVFAVNPEAGQVEGDTCYPDLTSSTALVKAGARLRTVVPAGLRPGRAPPRGGRRRVAAAAAPR